MNAEVSNRRVGTTYYRRLQKCCYFTFSKKHVVLAAYLSTAVAVIVFLYRYTYIPNLEQSSGTNKAIQKVTSPLYKPLQTQEKSKITPAQASYNRLLHYILHPRTPCESSKVLGGVVGMKNKLDGDKMVCIKPGPGFPKECIVYSFGIANEWSFDEDMHKQFGCSVYAFDPSMNMKDHLHSEGIWFYNLGIGKYNEKIKVHGKSWEMRSMDLILEKLGHRNKSIDLLKIDIEGAECEVLDDMMNKKLLNHVNHLCIEIHLLSNQNWTRVLKLFERIEAEAGLGHFSTRNNTQVPMQLVPGFADRYEQHLFEMAWYRH